MLIFINALMLRCINSNPIQGRLCLKICNVVGICCNRYLVFKHFIERFRIEEEYTFGFFLQNESMFYTKIVTARQTVLFHDTLSTTSCIGEASSVTGLSVDM